MVSVDRDTKTGATTVTVLLDMTDKPFVVKQAEEKIEFNGQHCKVLYFPLSYGYAKTYDGIQGATVTGKLACAVTPRMPRGMFYVGVTRVRALDTLYIIPNVNKYNAVDDARRILLENPGITKVDPYVTNFTRDRRRREERAPRDAAIYDSIPREGVRPQPSVCVVCGGSPEVVLTPCSHLAACHECWTDARRKQVATCPACAGLVTGVLYVKTSSVSRRDLAAVGE